MILKERLREILKGFYDSEPKDFEVNIDKIENEIISLFVDSIKESKFPRSN